MKIELDSDNVTVIQTTVSVARAYLDGKEVEECFPNFENALDNAQGEVHDGLHQVAYVVIRVTA